tara:strand:- start:505 stop:702 length:198 start_codon:yes stop_codon:yes gene_type:complete
MTKIIQSVCLKNTLKIYQAIKFMYRKNGIQLKIPEPNHQNIKSHAELDFYYSKLSHCIKFPEYYK